MKGYEELLRHQIRTKRLHDYVKSLLGKGDPHLKCIEIKDVEPRTSPSNQLEFKVYFSAEIVDYPSLQRTSMLYIVQADDDRLAEILA